MGVIDCDGYLLGVLYRVWDPGGVITRIDHHN